MADASAPRAKLHRLIRFGLVGSVNTCAAYLTFATLIHFGVHFATATLLGSIVSMLMGYKLHGVFVFRHPGEGRFLRFLGIFLTMYGLSVGIQALARIWMNGYLAGGLAALVTIPISFLLNGSLVFRPDPPRETEGTTPVILHACMICGSRNLAPVYTRCKDFFLGTEIVVDYSRCAACGLTQQVPLPDSTDGFYADYPIHNPKSKIFSLARKLLIRGVYFDPTPSDIGSTLLDFGCGDGSYLETVEGRVGRRLGFEASLSQARKVASRLSLPVASDLEDAFSVPEGSVDIVTAHFVLEHLTDLRGTFAYWRRVLKPGGRLHLALPDIDCFEARLFGRRWHGLDAPRHVSFPGGGNLARLAEESGFRITRQRTGIFPNTWGASLVAAGLGRHHQGLFLLLMPVAFLLACLLPKSTAIYEMTREP